MKNILGIIIALPIFALSQRDWTPDPMCDYPSYVIQRFPYYGNCSLYWECYEGTKYLMECPEYMHFHREIAQCENRNNFDCDPYEATTMPTTKSTITHTPPTTRLTTDSDLDPRCEDGELSYWPHPTDCSKYVQCYKGQSYEMECPPGLFFSESQEKCVGASDSECCVDGVCNK